MNSEKYRLMVYFAHSTLVIYQGSIVCYKGIDVEEFRKLNENVCKRVFDEGLSIFGYELSHHQMDKACAVFIQTKYQPSKVEDTEVYQLKEG